jgi:hypothetical protein
LGRVGQKEALGHAAGNVFLSGAPQISLGGGLGDAIGDALTNYDLQRGPAIGSIFLGSGPGFSGQASGRAAHGQACVYIMD